MIIDTHLHLGGCITPKFVWETIQKYDLKYIGETYDEVFSRMVIKNNEPRTFRRFLDKFKILDEIPWNEDLIDKMIMSVSELLSDIDYVFMDFSINKYMNIGWCKDEAIKFIYERFEHYMPNKVGLILAIKYENSQASQKQYSKLIEKSEIASKLIGLDLVGDEDYFNSSFYKPLFEQWNKAGKLTRAHVGETKSCENIRSAILDLNVTNVAHGLKVLDSDYIVRLAKDREISFDLSITSNYKTGIINSRHPIRKMLDSGLTITLGTDDPVQFSNSITSEFTNAEHCGVSVEQLEDIRRNAVKLHDKYCK